MVERFTIQEIKNYLLSKDSLGDIHYCLSAENIRKANEPEPKDDDEKDNEFVEQHLEYIKSRTCSCGRVGDDVKQRTMFGRLTVAMCEKCSSDWYYENVH